MADLLTLPAEIRLTIYHYAFIPPQEIQLCTCQPVPEPATGWYWRMPKYCTCYSDAGADGRELNKALNLLQPELALTCRQINQEVKAIEQNKLVTGRSTNITFCSQSCLKELLKASNTARKSAMKSFTLRYDLKVHLKHKNTLYKAWKSREYQITGDMLSELDVVQYKILGEHFESVKDALCITVPRAGSWIEKLALEDMLEFWCSVGEPRSAEQRKQWRADND